MQYSSDREEGERPREQEEVHDGPCGGLPGLIRARIEDGSFGASYPVVCEDGRGPTGCEESTFWTALRRRLRLCRKAPGSNASTNRRASSSGGPRTKETKNADKRRAQKHGKSSCRSSRCPRRRSSFAEGPRHG